MEGNLSIENGKICGLTECNKKARYRVFWKEDGIIPGIIIEKWGLICRKRHITKLIKLYDKCPQAHFQLQKIIKLKDNSEVRIV